LLCCVLVRERKQICVNIHFSRLSITFCSLYYVFPRWCISVQSWTTSREPSHVLINWVLMGVVMRFREVNITFFFACALHICLGVTVACDNITFVQPMPLIVQIQNIQIFPGPWRASSLLTHPHISTTIHVVCAGILTSPGSLVVLFLL